MLDGGDILGALWKLRDWPTYWPPGFGKWLWFVVALAVLPMLWFRLVDKSHHEAFLVQQERTARLRNLDEEHFRSVGALWIQQQNTTASEQIEIRAQDAEQQSDGSLTRRVALVYPDSVSRFSYAVLASHSVWLRGSSVAFEGGTHGVVITDALRRDYVEALVKESDKLVCIGLASSEHATPAENTRLSDDRAINLCHALHNIGYADATRQQTYGLSLGEPPPATQTIDATLQRTVIIVRIFNSRRLPRPDDIVQALTQLVQIPGATISQYRREGAPRMTFRRIGRGALNGAAGNDWRDADNAHPFN